MSSRWQLIRLGPLGGQVHQLKTGESVIGRGLNSEIRLVSLVVSRNHCKLIVKDDAVYIEDLGSSNGTFVDQTRIPSLSKSRLHNGSVMGFGVSDEIVSDNLMEEQRFEYQLISVDQVQKEDDIFPLELQRDLIVPHYNNLIPSVVLSRLDCETVIGKNLPSLPTSRVPTPNTLTPTTIYVIDDGDEIASKSVKQKQLQIRLDSLNREPKNEKIILNKESLTKGNAILPFQLQSDLILSQCKKSHPTVVITRIDCKTDVGKNLPSLPTLQEPLECSFPTHSSYDITVDSSEEELASQIFKSKEEFQDDVISIGDSDSNSDSETWSNRFSQAFGPRILTSHKIKVEPKDIVRKEKVTCNNTHTTNNGPEVSNVNMQAKASTENAESQNRAIKKIADTMPREKILGKRLAILIDPLPPPKKMNKRQSNHQTKPTKEVKVNIAKKKKCEGKKNRKDQKPKPRTEETTSYDVTSRKRIAHPGSSNRGLCLVEPPPPLKRKSSKHVSGRKSDLVPPPLPLTENSENISKGKNGNDTSFKINAPKILKVSDGVRLAKFKKNVSFSEKNEVCTFEIEEGNQMEKTIKAKEPMFSRGYNITNNFILEQNIFSMVLSWNPAWMSECLNSEYPKILGNKVAVPKLHFYDNFNDYAMIIGDLLLIEIWECIMQAYKRIKSLKAEQIINLTFDFVVEPNNAIRCPTTVLYTSIQLPKSTKGMRITRVGNLLQLYFSTQCGEKSCFSYVKNLKTQQRDNIQILQMQLLVMTSGDFLKLHNGQPMRARNLNYLKNEILLAQSIDYMQKSPLRNIILRPTPAHFNAPKANVNLVEADKSQWTKDLNASQLEAVNTCINMVFSPDPSIQLIQGPPGTGKSKVICSTVLRYQYDIKNPPPIRGKILICTTSNAAIDEIFLRLLKVRKTLPKGKRFRMVRVGREEAMHPQVKLFSSQSLAQNDCQQVALTDHQFQEEIKYLEEKINSWQLSAESNDGSARAAYCLSRVNDYQCRLDSFQSTRRLRSGITEGPSQDEIARAERRTIEGADIIATTLSSAGSDKMIRLKGKIGLCIIDEAGQATEPEALVALLLDINKIALVGDPQQLPGYICSQKAKTLGLGESLFARISHCSEMWPSSPVILLDTQYRMRPEISMWPNEAFYASLLKNGPVHPPTTLAGLPEYRIVQVVTKVGGQVEGVNAAEAWATSHIATAIAKSYHAASIAVLTPYAAHVTAIESCFTMMKTDIDVSTVDRFQGKERDIIIVSLARSSGLGFLIDTGRMAVLLTRAKYSLIVVLNPNAVCGNELWRNLCDNAHRRSVMRFLPLEYCTQKHIDNILYRIK